MKRLRSIKREKLMPSERAKAHFLQAKLTRSLASQAEHGRLIPDDPVHPQEHLAKDRHTKVVHHHPNSRFVGVEYQPPMEEEADAPTVKTDDDADAVIEQTPTATPLRRGRSRTVRDTSTNASIASTAEAVIARLEGGKRVTETIADDDSDDEDGLLAEGVVGHVNIGRSTSRVRRSTLNRMKRIKRRLDQRPKRHRGQLATYSINKTLTIMPVLLMSRRDDDLYTSKSIETL